MLSSRARLLMTLGGTLVLGITAVLMGFRRRAPSRQVHIDTSLPSPKLHVSKRSTVLTLLALITIGGAVYAGHEMRAAQSRKQAAIALTGGDPDHAPSLMLRYGCVGCHTIPGVTGARGMVGPNLADVSRRVYLGGVATNTPDNLIHWIVNPRKIDPKTAMPVTGVSEREARDIAAYLYSR